MPRLGSTSATTASVELQAITAVVVGGTALKGGAGRVWDDLRASHPRTGGQYHAALQLYCEYLIGTIQGSIIIIAMLTALLTATPATEPSREDT